MSGTDFGRRRLLDRLAPGPELGRPIGLLATTYEFDPQFFESEFLPALLGLGAWSDRSWAGRLALENALAKLEACCVLVDQRRYRGRPRSLRLDVRPAIGSGGELLHAKLLLVVHEHAVRLQVASANLTQAGYRENREVALPLVATAETPEVAAVVRDALSELPERLAPWWSAAAAKVVAVAEARLTTWASSPRPGGDAVLWSGGGDALWRRVIDALPAGERVERISIVSPFWSEEGSDGPLTMLLRALRDRGASAEHPRIDLYVEAEPSTPGEFRPLLPPLGGFDPAGIGARAFAHAIDPLPREEPAFTEVVKRRSLHAKVVVLQCVSGALAYAGSANFSRPGWGFATRGNIEAGVCLFRRGGVLSKALVPPTVGDAVELTASTPLPAVQLESEPEPSVPTFLRDVTLAVSPTSADRLELVVRTERAAVGGEFTLRDGSSERVLLSGTPESPARLVANLDSETLKGLLVDPRVQVSWWASQEPVEYPVNVELAARAELPVVPGGGRPDERMLLAYYQGRVTLAELYPPPADWSEEDGSTVAVSGVEQRVDTSKIQSYLVREFVEALQGIRADLRAAATTTEAGMRAALTGPVSPLALARHVKEAAAAGERTPTAAGFQLAEIAACLKQAASAELAAPEWRAHAEAARSEIEGMLATLAARHPAELEAGAFRRYVRTVLRGRKPA